MLPLVLDEPRRVGLELLDSFLRSLARPQHQLDVRAHGTVIISIIDVGRAPDDFDLNSYIIYLQLLMKVEARMSGLRVMQAWGS